MMEVLWFKAKDAVENNEACDQYLSLLPFADNVTGHGSFDTIVLVYGTG